jgi:choline-sulfatase
MLGQYGCWGKQVYYDASIGVPLLISGPGISHPAKCEHQISLMDLFPTACGLAGLPVPTGLDGVDFSQTLMTPAQATAPRRYAPSASYRYGVRINYNAFSDDEPYCAWRCIRERSWKYVEVEDGEVLLFDLENDPRETTNMAGLPEHAERCRDMKTEMYRDFTWAEARRRLLADRERLPGYLSGHRPGTPNQYMLPDGRVFNAEESLYDIRWLPIPAGCSGGIIPQMNG